MVIMEELGMITKWLANLLPIQHIYIFTPPFGGEFCCIEATHCHPVRLVHGDEAKTENAPPAIQVDLSVALIQSEENWSQSHLALDCMLQSFQIYEQPLRVLVAKFHDLYYTFSPMSKF